MKNIRKILVIFSLLLVCAGLCAGRAQAKIHKGSWKKNIRWSYDTGKKELVVWGQGEMAEIENTDEGEDAPDWRFFFDEARRVKIQKGITKISGFVFYNFRNMTSLELPDTLREIGYAAFRDTLKLKKVRLPASLEVMGKGAFDGSGLREVRIPGGVKKISSEAFFSCEHLKKVILEEGVEKIDSGAFWGSTKLSVVKLPRSLRRIGPSSFLDTGLRKVTIPENVEEIGAGAFEAVKPEKATLKRVVIRSKKIRKWGKGIFDDARRDLVIEVPASKEKEYRKALKKKGLPKYVKIVGKRALD